MAHVHVFVSKVGRDNRIRVTCACGTPAPGTHPIRAADLLTHLRARQATS